MCLFSDEAPTACERMQQARLSINVEVNYNVVGQLQNASVRCLGPSQRMHVSCVLQRAAGKLHACLEVAPQACALNSALHPVNIPGATSLARAQHQIAAFKLRKYRAAQNRR